MTAPDFLLQRGYEGGRFQSWTVDLGKGRPRDYLFCPERKHAAGSTNDYQEVQLFQSVSKRLAAELAWRQPLPQTVQIGTMLDPFHGLQELWHETFETIKLLAQRKILSWLVTRGTIDSRLAEGLADYRDWVRIALAITSHEKHIQKILEPSAASIEQRLESFCRLNVNAIRAEILLEPILPNLTDTREHLDELLERLAGAGVTHITAGYLVLRPETRDAMAGALELPGWSEIALSAYSDGVRIRKGPQAPALMLPKARRQRGYALLMSLAANVGIKVRLSARSNPDFSSPATRF
jgi:DNA repair photolyase